MPHQAAQRAQWLQEAKRGAFRAMAHYRHRLQGDEPLSPEDRAGLIDLLLLMEEYVDRTWAPDMTTFTQLNSRRP